MPKSYSRREVQEMLKSYGSLIQAVENFGKESSYNTQNPPPRDKLAKFILYTLIPQYKRQVPEELRTIDLDRLEERCKEAII